MMLEIFTFLTTIFWLSPSTLAEWFNCTQLEPCNNDLTCTATPCVFDCDGLSSCRGITLNCLDNEYCHIYSGRTVDSAASLRDSTINCPKNNTCVFSGSAGNNAFRRATINCGENGECYFLIKQQRNHNRPTTFNATNSKFVRIFRVGPWSGNLPIAIYCPDNGHFGGITCELICSNEPHSCDNITIYAREGFRDVNITEYGTIEQSFTGSTMNCGENFSSSCSIDTTNPNQCASAPTTCETIIAPSFYPSDSPTNIPSVSPTDSPNASPTNAPSTIPTVSPTDVPSVPPTTNPSRVPTALPLASPTIAPSNAPTLSPTDNPTS